jgi:hypothetical protein
MEFQPASRLFRHWNEAGNRNPSPTVIWGEFLFVAQCEHFTVEEDWPEKGSRIACLEGDPFLISALAIDRFLLISTDQSLSEYRNQMSCIFGGIEAEKGTSTVPDSNGEYKIPGQPQTEPDPIDISAVYSLAQRVLGLLGDIIANADLDNSAARCVDALGMLGRNLRPYLDRRPAYDSLLTAYAGVAPQIEVLAGVEGTSATEWTILYGLQLVDFFAENGRVDLFRPEGLSPSVREVLEQSWPSLRVRIKTWSPKIGSIVPNMQIGTHESRKVYQGISPPNLADVRRIRKQVKWEYAHLLQSHQGEHDDLSGTREHPVAGIAASQKGRSQPKAPSEDDLKVYYYKAVTGKLQVELARDPELMKRLGRPLNQGTISRMLKRVSNWIEAGNPIPGLPEPLTSKPSSMDPERIDLGKRLDGRAKHQRPSRDSDDED